MITYLNKIQIVLYLDEKGKKEKTIFEIDKPMRLVMDLNSGDLTKPLTTFLTVESLGMKTFKNETEKNYDKIFDFMYLDPVKEKTLMDIHMENKSVGFEFPWGYIYLFPDGTYKVEVDSN